MKNKWASVTSSIFLFFLSQTGKQDPPKAKLQFLFYSPRSAIQHVLLLFTKIFFDLMSRWAIAGFPETNMFLFLIVILRWRWQDVKIKLLTCCLINVNKNSTYQHSRVLNSLSTARSRRGNNKTYWKHVCCTDPIQPTWFPTDSKGLEWWKMCTDPSLLYIYHKGFKCSVAPTLPPHFCNLLEGQLSKCECIWRRQFWKAGKPVKTTSVTKREREGREGEGESGERGSERDRAWTRE